jgi:hypothetical protein
MPEEGKIELVKKALIKEEGKWKVAYAQSELGMLLEERKIEAIKAITELSKKYEMTPEDLQMFLEIAPFLA